MGDEAKILEIIQAWAARVQSESVAFALDRRFRNMDARSLERHLEGIRKKAETISWVAAYELGKHISPDDIDVSVAASTPISDAKVKIKKAKGLNKRAIAQQAEDRIRGLATVNNIEIKEVSEEIYDDGLSPDYPSSAHLQKTLGMSWTQILALSQIGASTPDKHIGWA